MEKTKANITVGRYKVYYDDDRRKFDIYEVTGRLVGSYDTTQEARIIVMQLNAGKTR